MLRINRKVTGILAWGVLALVVGIPASDLLFKSPKNGPIAGSANALEEQAGPQNADAKLSPIEQKSVPLIEPPPGVSSTAPTPDPAVPAPRLEPLTTANVAPSSPSVQTMPVVQESSVESVEYPQTAGGFEQQTMVTYGAEPVTPPATTTYNAESDFTSDVRQSIANMQANRSTGSVNITGAQSGRSLDELLFSDEPPAQEQAWGQQGDWTDAEQVYPAESSPPEQATAQPRNGLVRLDMLGRQ